MKKNILYMIMALCLMTTACSKAIPDGFKVEDPQQYARIYLGNAFHGDQRFTMQPDQDTVINVYACYSGLLELDVPLSVTFEADLSLVDKYNETMRTDYLPLPLNNCVMEHRTVKIAIGDSSSDAMKLHLTSSDLQGKGPYMLPVTISNVSGADYQVNEDLRTLYVIVDFDDSSFEFPLYDRAGWKVIESSASSEGSLPTYVLDGDRNSCWTCDFSMDAEEVNMPHFITIDMQRPLLLHGLDFISRTRMLNGKEHHYAGQPGDVKVEISMDGTDWTTVIETATVPFGIESSLRFDNYVRGRYIRLTVTKTWITMNVMGYWMSFSELNVF